MGTGPSTAERPGPPRPLSESNGVAPGENNREFAQRNAPFRDGADDGALEVHLEPAHLLGRGRTSALLAAIVALHVALALWASPDFFLLHDTPAYSRIAWDLFNGEFELTHHAFPNRFGVTVPASLGFVFGLSKFTTGLWPLIASVSTIVILFFTTMRFFGRNAALLASLVLATSAVQIEYATLLLPDVVVSLFMALAVSCVAAGRTTASRGAKAAYGAGAAVAVYCGLLTTGKVVWAIPFFAGLMAMDLWKREHRRFWLAMAITAAAGAAAFLGAYHLATGDALYRLSGIEATHNTMPWTFVDKGAQELIQRLTYEPPLYLIRNAGFGVLVAFATAALVHAVRPWGFLPRGTRFWALYLCVVLGSFWFGTTSLRSFNPLPVVERSLMPLLFPLAMLAGVVLERTVAGRDSAKARRAALILAATFAVWMGVTTSWGLGAALSYGPFLALALLLWVSLHGTRLSLSPAIRACALVVVVVVAIAFRADNVHGQAVGQMYEEERAIVTEHLTGPEPTTVLTDGFSVFALPFHASEPLPDHVRLVPWDDPSLDATGTRVLVYVNQPRLMARKLNYGEPRPRFAVDPPDAWRQLAATPVRDGAHLYLYEVDSIGQVREQH